MSGMVCDRCQKSFKTEADLDQHRLDAHAFGSTSAASEAECEECETGEYSLRKIASEMSGMIFTQKGPSLERSGLVLGLVSMVGILALSFVLFLVVLRGQMAIWDQFGSWALYLLVGLLANAVLVWYVKAYGVLPHHLGMMIGMVSGMFSGFWVGLVLGATNGMFVGSLAGLLVGFLVGSYAGKCCGIMGVLEGQMAGYMAGPMGAMTSLMMLNDHYKIFIPVALFVQVTILAGLMYIVYTENNGRSLDLAQRNARTGFWKFFLMNFLVWLALSFIIFFGPKSTFTIFTAN